MTAVRPASSSLDRLAMCEEMCDELRFARCMVAAVDEVLAVAEGLLLLGGGVKSGRCWRSMAAAGEGPLRGPGCVP